MQQSWRNDADKLTFIVCLAPESLSDIKTLDSGIVPGSLDSPETMIGDVNLFLYPHEEDDEDEEGEAKDASIAAAQKKKVIGEIEIMIARKTNQGQGLGKAVLLSFVWYVVSNLGSLMEEYHASHGVGGSQAGSHLEYLRVKIDGNNTRSIKLFEGVGFRKVSETPNYFGELELRRPVHPDYAAELSRELGATPIPISYS
jgi:ribosomal protein S18 acetylase RimI-like enzyme